MKPTPLSFIAELMPLSEATAACYHIMSGGRTRRLRHDEVEQARHQLAATLADLVTVYAEDDGGIIPLAADELKARLEAQRVETERMNGLYVRRTDVIGAIEALQRKV